jgi:hypothetical protein
MGFPSSEVGYTSATTGRGDQVNEGHVVALEKKNFRCPSYSGLQLFSVKLETTFNKLSKTRDKTKEFLLLSHYDVSLDSRFPTFRLNRVVSLENLEESTCHSSGTIGYLKMRQLRYLETSETDFLVTRRHVRHEINLQIRRCENWKIAGKITLHMIYF